jgi:Domain of unknown function (DUF4124)
MLKPVVIAVFALAGSAAFAAGEIYRWKDASGSWHYSDQFHAGAEIIRASSSGNATPVSVTTATATQQETPATPSESLPVSKEVAQEVRQEAAAAKVKNCEKAKKYYDDLVQTQRIKRTDADGKVIFLNSTEIDTARLEARARRDLACSP